VLQQQKASQLKPKLQQRAAAMPPVIMGDATRLVGEFDLMPMRRRKSVVLDRLVHRDVEEPMAGRAPTGDVE
jgi:hypothetical protein